MEHRRPAEPAAPAGGAHALPAAQRLSKKSRRHGAVPARRDRLERRPLDGEPGGRLQPLRRRLDPRRAAPPPTPSTTSRSDAEHQRHRRLSAPTATHAPPLEDKALEDFLHDVVAGITGLGRDTLVRPRWQAEPPNLPARNVDWVGFGIPDRKRDTYRRRPARPRQPRRARRRRPDPSRGTAPALHLLRPNVPGERDPARRRPLIAQNREAAWARRASSWSRPASPPRRRDHQERQWYQRCDLDVWLRREIRREYPVLNLLSAGGEIFTTAARRHPSTPNPEGQPMPIGLPVSRLISASVFLNPQAAAFANINSLLILGDSDVIDTRLRIVSYGIDEEVAAAFGTNAPEYLAACCGSARARSPTSSTSASGRAGHGRPADRRGADRATRAGAGELHRDRHGSLKFADRRRRRGHRSPASTSRPAPT
jgi:hypothetical protein